MAWPFDSEEQLDEWADEFVAAHLEQPHDRDARDASALASEPGYVAISEGQAEALWRFILKVVERQPSEWALGMLAAGPIDDLIAMRGALFIERIEAEARENALFRQTLTGVWQNRTPSDLWARVERARDFPASPSH